MKQIQKFAHWKAAPNSIIHFIDKFGKQNLSWKQGNLGVCSPLQGNNIMAACSVSVTEIFLKIFFLCWTQKSVWVKFGTAKLFNYLFWHFLEDFSFFTFCQFNNTPLLNFNLKKYTVVLISFKHLFQKVSFTSDLSEVMAQYFFWKPFWNQSAT